MAHDAILCILADKTAFEIYKRVTKLEIR